jgi:hypothetical protein
VGLAGQNPDGLSVVGSKAQRNMSKEARLTIIGPAERFSRLSAKRELCRVMDREKIRFALDTPARLFEMRRDDVGGPHAMVGQQAVRGLKRRMRSTRKRQTRAWLGRERI